MTMTFTIPELKELKERFRQLAGKDREQLSVSFLKVKLGVHTESEVKLVRAFLGLPKMELEPEYIDHLINYFHHESSTLPEFFAMEESMDEVTEKTYKPILPEYKPEEADTLKEEEKPLS